MRIRLARAFLGLALLPLTLALAPGCGSDRPERELEEAAKLLRETRSEVEEARTAVEEKRAAVARAEQALAESQKELRAAEDRLAQAGSRVESRATDAAIFRRIQSRLLEEKALQEYAVVAQVSAGVVTLSGQVKSEKERERALEIARATPGVADVQDRIEVEAPQAKAR